MVPMLPGGIGVPELLIILAVLLLLFGGTKLAGLGKSTGKALREFKEETKGLTDKPKAEGGKRPADGELTEGELTEAELVDPEPTNEQIKNDPVRHQATADQRRDV